MSIKSGIASQYKASLIMLKNTINECDPELWKSNKYKNQFWHIAYHALFFADLYLSENDKAFKPWSKHKPEYQFMGQVPWPPHKEPNIGEPYSQIEILEYLDIIYNNLEERIEKTDLDKPSGFSWLPCDKFELQIYNIRHIQHHAGQLADRIREDKKIGIKWVFRV
jgi:hypothetical protein